MTINLRISLIVFSLILLIVTTYILKKGRISEKYSLLWYFMSAVILFVAVIPEIFVFIANSLGFKTMSNLVIGVIIALLTFMTIALTIIVAGHKRQITLLIQELSLLKSEVHKNGDKRK